MIENAISTAKNKWKASSPQKQKTESITKAIGKKFEEKMKKSRDVDEIGEWASRKEPLSDF